MICFPCFNFQKHKILRINVAFFDRIFHAGGPNMSDEARLIFYVSFRLPDADANSLGSDSAHSMRTELRGRFKLGDFRR